jgi:hypothetical protein
VVLRFPRFLCLLVVSHDETLAPYAQAHDRSRPHAAHP